MFPDTSTYTVRGVSLTVNPVPAKPTQPSEQPTQPSGQPAQSDAEKYGKRIKIRQIVITVGDVITSPNIDINDITVEEVPAAPSIFLMMLAVAPEESAQLPAGTTAKWANFDQVKRDATKAGTYTEDVLLTFLDTSTYTAQASLLVKPKAAPTTPTTKPGQGTTTDHNQGSATAPSTKPSQSTEPSTTLSHDQGSATTTKPDQSAAPVQSDQPSVNVPTVPESETTSQSNATASQSDQPAAESDSAVVSTPSTVIPQTATTATAETRQQVQTVAMPGDDLVATTQTATPAKMATANQQANKQLPQTGNNTSSAFALIRLVFTTVLGMFGIEKRHN